MVAMLHTVGYMESLPEVSSLLIVIAAVTTDMKACRIMARNACG
jgi:hypothetical protein